VVGVELRRAVQEVVARCLVACGVRRARGAAEP
jgi:hypothetical protein